MKAVFGFEDREMFGNMMKTFVETQATDVESLKNAIGDKNVGDSASLAHKLKSSARTIGAGPLADLCEEIESFGKGGSFPHTRDLPKELDVQFHNVREFVEEYTTA